MTLPLAQSPNSVAGCGRKVWEDALAWHAAGELEEAERLYGQLYHDLAELDPDQALHSLQNMAVLAEQVCGSTAAQLPLLTPLLQGL